MPNVFVTESTGRCFSLRDLPLYEGCPYPDTRLVPALYHIIPLPEACDEVSLRSMARYQALCNKLPRCLVLDATRAIFIDTDGNESDPVPPPRGGIVISDQLRPAAVVERDAGWKDRSQRLRTYVERQSCVREGRYLLGDLTKGGRLATEKERRALSGTTEQGIPRGLSQCPVCGEWKGQCLDTIPSGKIIVTVSCQCENTNRCAACLDQLAMRKLNANDFDVTNGKI